MPPRAGRRLGHDMQATLIDEVVSEDLTVDAFWLDIVSDDAETPLVTVTLSAEESDTDTDTEDRKSTR